MNETKPFPRKESIFACLDALAESQAASELAPSESAGPLPVVGSGGVVGLRAAAAEISGLIKHADMCAENFMLMAKGYRITGQAEDAKRAIECAQIHAAYAVYVTNIQRLMASTIERQPEPNRE